MTWLLDDRSRLDGYKRGDATVLAEVYQVYAQQLARSLHHGFTLRSRGEALRFRGLRAPFDLDDVVQETFVRAFGDNARQGYDGLRPFRGYLFAIARNVLVDQWRRQGRYQDLFDPVEDTDVERAQGGVEPGPTPEEQLAQAQLKQVYDRFLAELKPDSRELWRLRYQSKLTRHEIGRRMGLTHMQVRSREERLRGLLYRRLVATGYLPEQALLLLLTTTTGGA